MAAAGLRSFRVYRHNSVAFYREKAIGETDEYAEALKQFQAQSDHSIALRIHLKMSKQDLRSCRMQSTRRSNRASS